MGLSEKIKLTTGLNCTLLCLVQLLAYSRAIFFPNCTQTHVGYLYIKVVNTVVPQSLHFNKIHDPQRYMKNSINDVISFRTHCGWISFVNIKGTVSRYIDKNRTGACGLGRNRRLLRHTELVFLSTVCARRVVLVLFTNMDAVN